MLYYWHIFFLRAICHPEFVCNFWIFNEREKKFRDFEKKMLREQGLKKKSEKI